MKSKFMKKKFVANGTFLITLCIVFSKILDILYVYKTVELIVPSKLTCRLTLAISTYLLIFIIIF